MNIFGWIGIALIVDAISIVLLVAWSVRNSRRLKEVEQDVRRLYLRQIREPPLEMHSPRCDVTTSTSD